MTISSLVGSKNFCLLFSVSWDFFCTGMIVSIELPNLVPQQRTGDCFEIHILH